MSGPTRRFDPSELREPGATPAPDAESAALLATARDLEEFARAESVMPTVGFEDRVMAAVAAEAPPRPVIAGGRLAGFATAVRDSWRIAFSGGRPAAVRAQAFALVLLVIVATGSVGTLAVAGVARLLADGPTPSPTIDDRPSPSIAPPATSSPTPAPTLTPSPSPSPAPTLTPSPSPSPSAEPSETPEATGGSGGTARPTSEAEETPEGTDDDSGTPKPEDTPDPDDTPEPDDTPKPDDTPDPNDD
jgi:hypothetical protein